MKTVYRPSWDEIWMTVAQAVSARSLCSRAQVGAVIVTSDNRVESVTYNGPSPKFNHLNRPCTEWCPRAQRGDELSPTYDDCPSGHAEANGIARSDWQKLTGGTIYTTSSCCMGCAKLICQTGIARLVHIVDSTMAHRSTDKVEAFLHGNGVAPFRWTPGDPYGPAVRARNTVRRPGGDGW